VCSTGTCTPICCIISSGAPCTPGETFPCYGATTCTGSACVFTDPGVGTCTGNVTLGACQ
jgi:hypothetical protein